MNKDLKEKLEKMLVRTRIVVSCDMGKSRIDFDKKASVKISSFIYSHLLKKLPKEGEHTEYCRYYMNAENHGCCCEGGYLSVSEIKQILRRELKGK